METYKDVPEMKEFLVKFMGLMGEHFTALADAAPPAAAPRGHLALRERARSGACSPRGSFRCRQPPR